jgi:uncharacterized protein (DUF2147 family)
MKDKNCSFLFVVGLFVSGVLLLTAACQNYNSENTSLNTNKTVMNQNSSPAAANASSVAVDNAANKKDSINSDEISTNNSVNGNSNVPPLVEETPDKTEFTGTAGITDKKNHVKGVAVLKQVRVAGHENYDRVVFEFEGAEMPGYHIEYVDKPVRACGSGNVVPLKGDAWLEIRFTPAAAHTDDGQPTIKNREQSPNLRVIREMKTTCDFEAEVEWVLGVASPNRYRVLELKNPTRLTVDIRH